MVVPRPERHPVDRILDVSRDLVLRDGALGVTVLPDSRGQWCTRRVGVLPVFDRGRPAGDDVVTRCAPVAGTLPRAAECGCGYLIEAAVAAGLAIHDFAWQEPADARLLAALRREDLVGEVTDPALPVLHFRKSTTRCARRSPHSRATPLWACHPRHRRADDPARWSICRRGRSGATWWAVLPCPAVSVPN